MVNILLEGYLINKKWIYNELKNYLNPNHSVAVVAFSFRDSVVKCSEDWNSLYGKENGRYYNGIIESFSAYGIKEDNVRFINYYIDTKESAKQKIENSDVIYFLGGLPDRMMDRLYEFDLVDILKNTDKIIMGYSAGALIQLDEYYVYPDKDYSEFQYLKGLGYIDSFYLECHYDGNNDQTSAVNKVVYEKKKPLYANALNSGAIIVDNGKIKLIGDVKTFN